MKTIEVNKKNAVVHNASDTVVLVNPSELEVNEMLRKIDIKDKEYIRLYDSIDRNGIESPITCTAADSPYSPLTVITGNRRLHIAKKLKLDEIPVIFRKVTSESELLKIAYHLNVQKTSKVYELLSRFREDVKEGSSVKQIASKYGFSEKIIYDALKIAGNPVLEAIAKKSFKNAVTLAGQKTFFEGLSEKEKKEVAEKAIVQTEKDFKDSLRGLKDRRKAERTGKELVDIPKFQFERKNLFFAQLYETKEKSISVDKLKSFLYGELENWRIGINQLIN